MVPILPGDQLVALVTTHENNREPTYDERLAKKESQELKLRDELFCTSTACNSHPVEPMNVSPKIQVQETK